MQITEFFRQSYYAAAELLSTLTWPLIKVALVVIIGLILSPLAQKIVLGLTKRAKADEQLVPIIKTGVRSSVYLIIAAISIGILSTALGNYNALWLTGFGFTVVKAISLFLAGIVGISYGEKLLKKLLTLSKIDVILHSFICSSVRIIAYIILTISCLDLLGLPTATLIASLSAAGLALSLAVKDNLSNLFGGIVVIITKPFVSGDYIEMDGLGGSVAEIGLIYTTLYTVDNKKVFVPNNDAAKAKIINYSSEPNRRLDLSYTIGYRDDFVKAKQIILKIAQASGLLLSDPAPVIGVIKQGPNGMELTVRLWVERAEYFNLMFYMNEQVKLAFDKEGISIPHNQMDIHILEQPLGK